MCPPWQGRKLQGVKEFLLLSHDSLSVTKQDDMRTMKSILSGASAASEDLLRSLRHLLGLSDRDQASSICVIPLGTNHCVTL